MKILTHRRINGFSWPPCWQQILSWAILVIILTICFGLLVPSFPEIYQWLLYLMCGVMVTSNLIFHIWAMAIDPAVLEVRQRQSRLMAMLPDGKKIFEDGRCQVCEIDIPPEDLHHCGKCNKCIQQFDHHCVMMNNCVGIRNYWLFFSSVATALIFCVFVLLLCISLFILYFTENDFDAKVFKIFSVRVAIEPWLAVMIFGVFLISFCILNLGFLFVFHLFLIRTKQTTYDYITKRNEKNKEKKDGQFKGIKGINKVNPCGKLASDDSGTSDRKSFGERPESRDSNQNCPTEDQQKPLIFSRKGDQHVMETEVFPTECPFLDMFKRKETEYGSAVHKTILHSREKESLQVTEMRS